MVIAKVAQCHFTDTGFDFMDAQDLFANHLDYLMIYQLHELQLFTVVLLVHLLQGNWIV